MRHLKIIAGILLLAVTTACGANQVPGTLLPGSPPTEALSTPATEIIQPSPPTQESILETISPEIPTDTEPPASSSTLETTPPAAQDERPLYLLDARFDYGYHRLAVKETIEYPNRTGDTISEILLIIEPNLTPGIFSLTSLGMGDGTAINDYTLDKRRLTFSLPEPLPVGEKIRINIEYELTLPGIPDPEDGTRPQPFGYTWRQTNLVDWYPFIPPYSPGQGWIAHDHWYFAEHLVFEPADFHVIIHTDNAPEGLVLASGTPNVSTTPGEYEYKLENARTFVFSASPDYETASTTVTTSYGDITIVSTYFPFDQAAGEQVLADTAAAVELYARLFGPYQRSYLTVVEADFLDGMEYSGLYFLSRGFYNLYDGTQRGYLTIIAVHETAHQWWYDSVGNDQALEPWLDEAMCTYTEYLFYENNQPELAEWWWAYRVDYYSPEGYIDGSIYDYNGFMFYRNAVYLRGAQFLQDLRTLAGDEAFFQFLQDYAQQEAGKISTRDDFFRIFSEHSSADLQGLLDQYFMH